MLRIALSWLMVLTVPISESIACVCHKRPGPRKALRQAEAVFTGRVQSVDDGIVFLAVTRAWKGIPENVRYIEVYAPDPEACGFRFTLGQQYLVYATDGQPKNWASSYGSPDAPEGFLTVSGCSRTCRFTDGIEDIDKLGPPKWQASDPAQDSPREDNSPDG